MEQLKSYPESTLQDIYKSFFQDEFGPGHLLNNLDHAREYFDMELEDMVSRGRHESEAVGLGKNFVRVPMDLVKDDLIKDEDFFAAFIESSKDFKKPDLVYWKQRWELIEGVVEKMGLQLPDFDRDKQALRKMLDQGETMVHHSDRYNMAYDPHYRIMSLSMWEQLRAKAQT